MLVYSPREYFAHPFFINKLKKRFSGKQYIEIRVKDLDMSEYREKIIYLLNDGNLDDFIIANLLNLMN